MKRIEESCDIVVSLLNYTTVTKGAAMTDQVRFRLLIARTDTGSYCAVFAMDETVLDVAGEDEWDAEVKAQGWPEEYEYAKVTVTIPAEQIAGAFPPVIEVEGQVQA